MFAGNNFGVGTKGGVEIVAHTLRDFVAHHTGEGLAALKVDFRNAFNCVDRSVFLAAVHHDFPGLFPWVEWCCGQHSILQYNHEDIVSSAASNKATPLLSLALRPIVEQIRAHLISMTIVGHPQLLPAAWDIIRLQGSEAGPNVSGFG